LCEYFEPAQESNEEIKVAKNQFRDLISETNS